MVGSNPSPCNLTFGGGEPCARGSRIAVQDVQDVLGWLAAGMTQQEILQDYPDLTRADLSSL